MAGPVIREQGDTMQVYTQGILVTARNDISQSKRTLKWHRQPAVALLDFELQVAWTATHVASNSLSIAQSHCMLGKRGKSYFQLT